MLTTEPEEFETKYLLKGKTKMTEFESEPYHYLQVQLSRLILWI